MYLLLFFLSFAIRYYSVYYMHFCGAVCMYGSLCDPYVLCILFRFFSVESLIHVIFALGMSRCVIDVDIFVFFFCSFFPFISAIHSSIDYCTNVRNEHGLEIKFNKTRIRMTYIEKQLKYISFIICIRTRT